MPFYAVRTRFLDNLASPDIQGLPMKTVEAQWGGIATLTRLRREKLEGFVERVFGDKDGLDVPKRAHKALGTLAVIRAMLDASQVLAEDSTKPARPGPARSLRRWIISVD